jgi:tRNA A37 threonylcarbamoyltransferase TsaD
MSYLTAITQVASNQYIRLSLNDFCAKYSLRTHYPSPSLCTDNG